MFGTPKSRTSGDVNRGSNTSSIGVWIIRVLLRTGFEIESLGWNFTQFLLERYQNQVSKITSDIGSGCNQACLKGRNQEGDCLVVKSMSNCSDLTWPKTPNGGLVREIPLFLGNLGWWNYNWARWSITPPCFFKPFKVGWFPIFVVCLFVSNFLGEFPEFNRKGFCTSSAVDMIGGGGLRTETLDVWPLFTHIYTLKYPTCR